MRTRQASPEVGWDDDSRPTLTVAPVVERDKKQVLRLAQFFSADYRTAMAGLMEDHFSTGGSAADFLEEVFLPELREACCECMSRAFDLLLAERKPKYLIDVIKWKFGASLIYERRSISDIAQTHGVRKQAVQQKAKKLDAIFPGLRSITRRSDGARRKMSLRNSRRGKCA